MKSVSVVPSVVPRSFFIFWYSICKNFISSRSTVSSKYRTFPSNSMCSCCISPFIFCCFSNLLPVITGGMIHLDILLWLVYVFYVFFISMMSAPSLSNLWCTSLLLLETIIVNSVCYCYLNKSLNNPFTASTEKITRSCFALFKPSIFFTLSLKASSIIKKPQKFENQNGLRNAWWKSRTAWRKEKHMHLIN